MGFQMPFSVGVLQPYLLIYKITVRAEKNIGKGDIYSWLVVVQTCTNTMETSVAVPQEAWNIHTSRSNYTTLDNIPK